MRPTAAAAKPSFLLARHQPFPFPESSRAAAATDPCKPPKKSRRAGRSWRAASAGSDERGQSVSTVATTPSGRRARLSARRRESIRLLDVLPGQGGIGEFLRHPAGVESLLNTRALQSFAPVEPESEAGPAVGAAAGEHQAPGRAAGPGRHRRVPAAPRRRGVPAQHPGAAELRAGGAGVGVGPGRRFQVHAAPHGLPRLPGRPGPGPPRHPDRRRLHRRDALLQAVMTNRITWGDNGDQEPCLDIDVNLEVTLELLGMSRWQGFPTRRTLKFLICRFSGVHEAIQLAPAVGSGETRQPADARAA
ncbi:hypothetical protein TRIUR3_01975 [Triticum urartu]|uniref:Uncharacterized protein n=1 Tax=Triticum urartu TaxID=4572 RepID=M7ZLB9_TRIUA|nr:hypothetical protein TRIUR3_01975 [Triticum urartu]